MIELKQLTIQTEEFILDAIDLTVADGDIYLLLCRNEQCSGLLADIIAGFQPLKEGDILIDQRSVIGLTQRPVTIVNRLENPADFEPDLKLGDILELNCRIGGLNRKRVLEILLLFNLFDVNLKNKIRSCSVLDFKAFYVSLLLAQEHSNIVINDFIRGEEKAFELKFNRVLKQLKKESKSILYLTNDIFYAYRIADRVSFLKNGHIVPAEPIVSKDFEELDPNEIYKKYLS